MGGTPAGWAELAVGTEGAVQLCTPAGWAGLSVGTEGAVQLAFGGGS